MVSFTLSLIYFTVIIEDCNKNNTHCIKYRNFTLFLGMEILWKGTVSAVSRDSPKLCENCAFPQNFHTSKLGEITVFYAVI